jgi:hypothetical protein
VRPVPEGAAVRPVPEGAAVKPVPEGAAGARTALLLSGVSGRDDPGPHRPDLILDGLPELSAFLADVWPERPNLSL